ncbi:MAG: glycosyltransferase family 4 protein [Methanocella sp.]
MDKITVLIVSQLYAPETGGNASRIGDMAKQLKMLGLDVQIISPHPTMPFGTFPRDWKRKSGRTVDGIAVTGLWTWQPASGDPGFVSRMAYYLIFSVHAAVWALLNAKKYDVIITSSPPIFVTLPGLLPKILFRKPWIVDVRDLWIDASISLGFIKKGSLYEKVSRRFEQLFYERSSLIAVTTLETIKRIRRSYVSLEKDKFVLISNGVDTEKFYRPPGKKKNQIIYSGNIGHAQDLEKVILAMREVTKRHDVKLVIVGDGDLKEQLIRTAKENGLDGCVVFRNLVPRDEVPGLISESCIGVAPLKDVETLEYAIPTKVFEYMACGIPFVGCSRGEIASIAERSGAGIIAPNSVEGIAVSICHLLDDPALEKEMGDNGRRFVKEHYDRKNIARVLRDRIVALAGRPATD